jgi:hypothetical protein
MSDYRVNQDLLSQKEQVEMKRLLVSIAFNWFRASSGTGIS